MMPVKANYPLSIPEELEKTPERLNPDWAAKMLGRPTVLVMELCISASYKRWKVKVQNKPN
jgi:hypothetical protein